MTDEERLQMITEQLLIVRDNLFRGMSKSIQKLQARSINEVLELPNFIESPQRQWVGLSNDEIEKTCGFGEYTVTSTRITLTHLAKAIEAKLKEKNNA